MTKLGQDADDPAIDRHGPYLQSLQQGRIRSHAIGRGHYPGERLAADELPGLLSLGFWDARGRQDWGMDLHRNEGLEIGFLETGRLRFYVDGKRYALAPGALTVTRPWQLHRQGHPTVEASRLHWCTLEVGARQPEDDWRWPAWCLLDREEKEELQTHLRRSSRSVWLAAPEVGNSLKQAVASLASPRSRISRMAISLNATLVALLDLLRSEPSPRRGGRMDGERRVRSFLKQLASGPEPLQARWTLGGMARRCGMGTTLFSKLCRELTNESPIDYVIRLRLERAASLLRRPTARSVLDIALDCGFSSSQYFAYQFRKRYRMTPSQWREVGRDD